MPETLKPQSFPTHRAIPHWTYLIIGLVLLVEAGRRVWIAWKAPAFGSIWNIVVVAALLVLWFWARRYPQIVQDRVIRAEMRARLERVLGAQRRADVMRLSPPELVGLRFASDAELPALVDDVLSGKLVKQDDIKRRVKDWQADWLRV